MDYKYRIFRIFTKLLQILILTAHFESLVTLILAQQSNFTSENEPILQCWNNIQIREVETRIEDGVMTIPEERKNRSIWTCCEEFHGPRCTKGIQESISKRLFQEIEDTDTEFFLVDTHLNEYYCPPNHPITVHLDKIQDNIDEMKLLINEYQEELDRLRLEHGKIMSCNEIPFCPENPSLICVYISRCGEDRIAFIHNETFEYGNCPGVRDFFVGEGCDIKIRDCGKTDPCLDAVCEGLNDTVCTVDYCTCSPMWVTETGEILECPDPDRRKPACEIPDLAEQCMKRREYFNRGINGHLNVIY